MEELLKDLNEQQRSAVTYNDGPQLVIAGAGSGKTRVLTYKILFLLNNGYTPYRIMALTFTNKAANTMRERILALTSPEVAHRLWMGTFHSIFLRILRQHAERLGFKRDFTIYDANDSKNLIKQIIKDMGLDDKTYKPNTIQNIISNAKNALMMPDDYERNATIIESDKINKRPQTATIYRAYAARCRVIGAMDFDDILLYTNILLRDNDDIKQQYQDLFQYILVDEYQDTNFAQHMIINRLTKDKGNLFVVGDDAQSIYSFRGANIDNILNLRNAYPNIKTFKLEQNYRSTKCIIEAANSLIEKNKLQIRKHAFTQNPQGSKIAVIQCYSDFEESYVVANQIISIKSQHGDSLNDFAVLYRTNAQSRVLEEALRKRNISYRIYGGISFYQRKEVKDAICYFRLIINPDDDEALRRIINFPSRGIGETTIQKIHDCASKHNVSMWRVISETTAFNLNVNSGTLRKLQAFKSIIDELINQERNGANAADIVRSAIKLSGLYELTNSDKTPENISRRENLEEILNHAKQFVDEAMEEGNDDQSLTGFLNIISLATDQDDSSEDTADNAKVTLMTAHSAKGLEFKNIIITGVEEDLFPSLMSKDSPSQIEEERRLLYVAITRAMNTCTITYSSSRYHNGQPKLCSPSRFLREINPTYVSWTQTNFSSGNGVCSYSNSRKSISNTRTYPSSTSGYAKHTHQTGFLSSKSERSAQNKPAQNFVPLHKAVMPSAATANDCHNVDELSIGMRIQHIRFGTGTIKEIDKTGNDPKIMVAFDTNGERKLLLKYAKFNII